MASVVPGRYQQPYVGYATNADHGAGCYIHPPSKQFVGKRLGDAALAIAYGEPIHWRSPSYASAKQLVDAPSDSSVAVAIKLSNLSDGGLALIYPYNYLSQGHTGKIPFDAPLNCTQTNEADPGTCVWAALQIAGVWRNATVHVAENDSSTLVLTVALRNGSAALAGAVVTGSAYAWGPVPLMNAYDRATGLPVLPWNRSLSNGAARP